MLVGLLAPACGVLESQQSFSLARDGGGVSGDAHVGLGDGGHAVDAHDGSLRDVRAHVDVSSADAGVDAHRVMTGDAGQVNLLQNPGF